MSEMAQLRTYRSIDRPLLKTNLDRIIAIMINRLDLSHNTRTSLNHCNRNNDSIGPENLRHADFPPQQCIQHRYYLFPLFQSQSQLISISTERKRIPLQSDFNI